MEAETTPCAAVARSVESTLLTGSPRETFLSPTPSLPAPRCLRASPTLIIIRFLLRAYRNPQCAPYEPAVELSPKERPVFHAAAVTIASTFVAKSTARRSGSHLGHVRPRPIRPSSDLVWTVAVPPSLCLRGLAQFCLVARAPVWPTQARIMTRDFPLPRPRQAQIAITVIVHDPVRRVRSSSSRVASTSLHHPVRRSLARIASSSMCLEFTASPSRSQHPCLVFGIHLFYVLVSLGLVVHPVSVAPCTDKVELC